MFRLLLHNALVVRLYFLPTSFFFHQKKIKNFEPDNKATFCFDLFCREQALSWKFFKSGEQITYTENFFVKLHRIFIAHTKIFGQAIEIYIFSQLYLLFVKYFFLSFLF